MDLISGFSSSSNDDTPSDDEIVYDHGDFNDTPFDLSAYDANLKAFHPTLSSSMNNAELLQRLQDVSNVADSSEHMSVSQGDGSMSSAEPGDDMASSHSSVPGSPVGDDMSSTDISVPSSPVCADMSCTYSSVPGSPVSDSSDTSSDFTGCVTSSDFTGYVTSSESSGSDSSVDSEESEMYYSNLSGDQEPTMNSEESMDDPVPAPVFILK